MNTIEPVAQSGNIVIKQKIRFGKPAIRGTRIAVTDILDLLRTGYRMDEIPGQYPDITAGDVKAALTFYKI